MSVFNHRHGLKALTISISLLLLAFQLTGCRDKEPEQSIPEQLQEGFSLVSSIPEDYPVSVTVGVADEYDSFTVSGLKDGTKAVYSAELGINGLKYSYSDIILSDGDNIYVNADSALNLADRLGYTFSDMEDFTGTYVKLPKSDFALPAVGNKIAEVIGPVLTENSATLDEESTKNVIDSVVMSDELSDVTKSALSLLHSVSSNSDELVAVWSEAGLFPIFSYEELQTRILSKTQDITGSEISFSKTDDSFSFSVKTDSGEEFFLSVSLAKKESVQLDDIRISDADSFVSALTDNIDSLIHSHWETDDFPYEITVKENILELTRTEDLFTETITLEWENGTLCRKTVQVISNELYFYNAVYKTLEENGYVLEKAVSPTEKNQGVLVFYTEAGSKFPSGYRTASNPGDLAIVLTADDLRF